MELLKPTDDPGVCPMCGRDESLTEPGAEGVNATVCRICSENIHLRTPGLTHIHGTTTDFDVFVYTPKETSTWPLDTDPVFISGSATGEDIDNHTDTITYNDLTDTEKQFVTALATNTELDEIDGVHQVDIKPSWEPVIRSIHPLYSQDGGSSLDDDTAHTIASRIPTPTAVYLNELYTTSPDKVREEIERVTSDTETTQETLV